MSAGRRRGLVDAPTSWGGQGRVCAVASPALGRVGQRLGGSEEALATLDQVLTTASEDDPKDFEFIIEIESEIASILRSADRIEEAEEIERRLNSVRAILADEQSAQ